MIGKYQKNGVSEVQKHRTKEQRLSALLEHGSLISVKGKK